MNENIANKLIDKLIGLFIYALFIVPFLIPYSYFPVSKFYSEASAMLFSLVIGILAIYRAPKIGISSAGISCGLFVIFLFLQILVIPIRLPGINLDVAMEFVVAGVMSIGITSLLNSDEEIQAKIIRQIAWAVLISVTIQALYGFLQYTGQAESYKDYILFNGSGDSNIFGNIGQKNDYADFISVGVFALAYLYFIRQINLTVFALYALFFGFIITVNTSRTSFVYFILALLATLGFMIFNRKKHLTNNRQVLVLILSMIVGLFILEALLPKIIAAFSTSHADANSGLYRFSESSIGQSTYRRFYEWYKDIIIFMHHPIFGIGWYQYPHEAIYLMNTERFMYIPANSALYTHSHNSPLNILAETGIVGFAITMIYGFGYSLYRMFKNFNNYHTLFVAFMILTIFGQSFFQYPLWYAYFLMFFILFLSLDKPIYQINNSKTIKGVATLVLLVFLGIGYSNIQTYNQMLTYTQVPEDADDYANNLQQLEKLVDSSSIWAMPALLVIDNYILPISPKTNAAMSPQDQAKYLDKLANVLPYPGAIFKQIISHKAIGDNEGSLAYANLLAHAFPYFKDKFADELQSNPAFSNEVAAIHGFQYEDRSVFAKKSN